MDNPFYTKHNSILNRTDTNEIIVGNSSVGSNRVLCKFAESSITPNPFSYDVYLINLLTVLRNNEKAPDPLAACDEDVGTFKTYITEYINTVYHRDPIVIFYLPHYKIPEAYSRTFNKRTTNLLELSSKLGRHVPKDVVDVSNDRCKMYFVRCQPALQPGKQILSYIRQLSNNGTQGKVLLWSNIAVDFHMASVMPSLDLIESYTARIIPSQVFGQKLFKSEHIPFNRLTHAAFGDSIFIQPMLQRNKKKQALQDAEDRSWKTLSNNQLINQLMTYGIEKQYLTRFKP